MTEIQTPATAVQTIEQAILEIGLPRSVSAATVDGSDKLYAYERGCEWIDSLNKKEDVSTKNLMSIFKDVAQQLPQNMNVDQDISYQADNLVFLQFQELRAELTVRVTDVAISDLRMQGKPALAGILDKQIKIVL